MGIMSAVTGQNNTQTAHYGNHSMTTAGVLQAVKDSVTPTTAINWEVENPEVKKTPVRATIAEADAAEREAQRYEQEVLNGLRLMKAEAKKQTAFAKLVRGHRNYMAQAAQSHYEAATANRGLAGKLQALRVQYAELGYGLDRKTESATQRVDDIAAKYKGVTA